MSVDDTSADRSAAAARSFHLGPHLVEPDRHCIVTAARVLTVQPKTMRFLCVLADQYGETLSRDALIDSVWDGVIVSDAAIDRVVCNARKALGDDARAPEYIETIRKRGFRLMVKPKFARPAAEVAPSAKPVSVPMPAVFAATARKMPSPLSAFALAAMAVLVIELWQHRTSLQWQGAPEALNVVAEAPAAQFPKVDEVPAPPPAPLPAKVVIRQAPVISASPIPAQHAENCDERAPIRSVGSDTAQLLF